MSEQQEFPFPGDELFSLAPDGPVPGLPQDDPAAAAREAARTDGPLKRLLDAHFLQYASYVIRDRAIPDLDDGLKPVQRRILFALHENDDGKFTKVANIVGYTMQFHPHGDASIADALIALVNRQYLIEGQGNFGNLLTGDPPAAARYIECRLTPLARSELFHDELTEFVPTYDGRRREPVALPARLPLLLLLGADGIAVGLSTRILPHNFRELIEAQIAILQKKPFAVFPDFPTGGLLDASGYDAGKGQVRVRALVEKKDASTLVIRELAFGTTTDSLIASIEDAARKNKIQVKSIQDFTAERVEIEVRLQPEEDADRAIEALYAFSQCEVPLSSRVVVLRDRKPVAMDVAEILRHNTDRLLEILRQELLLERRKLGEELHRKTLVEIFIEKRIYKTIEGCGTAEAVEETVRQALQPYRQRLGRDLSAKDLEMLLEIPIRRISRFDLEKNRAEMETARLQLAEAEKNLKELVPHAVRYLRGLLRKYGEAFPRRTRIATFGEVALRDITATELTIGYDREKGYLGSAVRGETLLQCSSYDKIVLFWKDGRYKAMPPPEKLFVGVGLVHAGVLDRDRVLTVVYTVDFFTYAKRFAVGGVIMNKEYRCLPSGGEICLFAEGPVETFFVRYAADSSQKIGQQEFEAAKVPVREPKARGCLMSAKRIASIAVSRPPDWDDSRTGPRGVFMD